MKAHLISLILATLTTLSLAYSAKELCMERTYLLNKLKVHFTEAASNPKLQKQLAAATLRANEQTKRWYYYPSEYNYKDYGDDRTLKITFSRIDCEIDIPFNQCPMNIVKQASKYEVTMVSSGTEGEDGGDIQSYTLTKL
uniref:Secreted protein n=1 Tax=Panagrellus redivivus TaxID=6233 RepID=A0A7E4UY79_PANRE